MIVRPIKAIIQCGAPDLVRAVTVYEEAWAHVEKDHGTVPWSGVVEGIENPGLITESKINPRSVVIINSSLNTSRGHQLAMPVKVYADKSGIMSSAYFMDPKRFGTVLWSRDDVTSD